MKSRRSPAEFSLSFLDVICCGFGAVILLLMITKTVQPQVIEEAMVDAESTIKELRDQLFEIRGETIILNSDLLVKREQISKYEDRIAILQGTLTRSRSAYQSLNNSQNTNALKKDRLASAKQALSEQQKRLLGSNAAKKNNLIGGIPVDSEYVIFVIDTSGSMQGLAWDRMIQEVENTLQIYPEVRGIQVLSDNGRALFPSIADRWLVDTPERRKLIVQRLKGFYVTSNSSPVEGIDAAIRRFSLPDPDKKISIYVFGDEFSLTGPSITQVVNSVRQMNRGTGDNLRVRIHAVGFPTTFLYAANPESGVRFATLMRTLTNLNGGAFVGLNDVKVE